MTYPEYTDEEIGEDLAFEAAARAEREAERYRETTDERYRDDVAQDERRARPA